MHGKLLPKFRYEHTIVGKDFFDVRSILIGVENSSWESCSLRNHVTPSTVIRTPDPVERGKPCYHQNFHEANPYRRGIIVWTSLMHNCRILFHNFEGDAVTPQRYCTEILLDHFQLFCSTVGRDFLLIAENAHPHWKPVVYDTLVW